MEEAIRDVDAKEGIRLTWNTLSNVRAETAKHIIPVVSLYKPIHGYHSGAIPQLNYPPVRCGKQGCDGILSPFSVLDFGSRHWSCIFCGRPNALPGQYRDVSPDNLPYELFSDTTSVYYRTTKAQPAPRTYWFLVDACSFDGERHDLLKEGLLTMLEALPDTAYVGVIRFSANIEVYALDNLSITKVHVFPAGKYSTAVLQKVLGRGGPAAVTPFSQFTRLKGECSEYVSRLFKSMKMNAFPVPPLERPKRCTGAALQLAASLVLGASAEGSGHIALFTQGPCTFGPGTVSPLSLKESLRGAGKGIAKLFSKETLYEEVASALGKKGHVVDIIAAGIDDFGFAEMRCVTEKTGGFAVFARDFDRNVYIQSITRMFARAFTEEDRVDPPMVRVFDAKTTARMTKGYAVKKVVGHGMPEEGSDRGGKSAPLVWKQGSLFERSTCAFVFEQFEDVPANSIVYIQFSTQFADSTGETYERVTTLVRYFGNSQNQQELVLGFDQEAACVYKAKELSVNADNGDGIDVIRQADRCLIRFMQKFCPFQRDAPTSLQMPETMHFFPEFVFFLRRLPALHTDGLSFDEVAYQRTVLLDEDSPSTMRIIRPSLASYHYTGERSPVELDSRSLKPDVALLVDTFHDVVIWRGASIVSWIEAGIMEQKEYWYFRDMLASIEKEAEEIVAGRLPVPRLTVCDQYSSQERILLCKVNPSSSVANSIEGEGQVIVTEDIDFSRFYEYLAERVVSA